MSPPAGGRKAAKPAREGNDVTAQRLEAASQIDWGAISASQCALRRPSLDERDTPEFFHVSVEIIGVYRSGIVYEVTEGGWLKQQAPNSPGMAAGFYSNLKEYWIGGCDECVNILSINPPTITRRDSDEF